MRPGARMGSLGLLGAAVLCLSGCGLWVQRHTDDDVVEPEKDAGVDAVVMRVQDSGIDEVEFDVLSTTGKEASGRIQLPAGGACEAKTRCRFRAAAGETLLLTSVPSPGAVSVWSLPSGFGECAAKSTGSLLATTFGLGKRKTSSSWPRVWPIHWILGLLGMM